jgi:hypothetical protein
LPSARQKVLGKEAVADVQFAERSLSSVTLGKAFAECKIVFAVCLEHTAKELIPVVINMKPFVRMALTCRHTKLLQTDEIIGRGTHAHMHPNKIHSQTGGAINLCCWSTLTRHFALACVN